MLSSLLAPLRGMLRQDCMPVHKKMADFDCRTGQTGFVRITLPRILPVL